jgi:hypothetical protein
VEACEQELENLEPEFVSKVLYTYLFIHTYIHTYIHSYLIYISLFFLQKSELLVQLREQASNAKSRIECMYVCMYVCINVCIFVYIYVCMCILYVCTKSKVFVCMIHALALYGKQGRGAQYASKAERDKFLQVRHKYFVCIHSMYVCMFDVCMFSYNSMIL